MMWLEAVRTNFQYINTWSTLSTLNNGPNDARRIVWARSRRRHPLKPSSSHQNLDRSKIIELVQKNTRKGRKSLTNGPNNARHVVWARARQRRPPRPSSSHQNLDRSKRLS